VLALLVLLGLLLYSSVVCFAGPATAAAPDATPQAVFRTPVPDSLIPFPEQRVGFVSFGMRDREVERLHSGFVKLEDRGPTLSEERMGFDFCTVILEDTRTYLQPSPAEYWDRIARMVRNAPGHLWFVGNEPDNHCRFGTFSGEYATRYHAIYTFIKSEDPTAQVGIGGIVRPSNIRTRWLERVLDAYHGRHEEPMPVDVWNIHNLLLSECPGECGCPPGGDCSDKCCSGGYVPREMWCERGMYIPQDQQDRIDLFKQFVYEFRQWMATRPEAQNKPLIITEMGVLAGLENNSFGRDRVNRFMSSAFDFLLTETDPVLGYAADGYRLVQRWTWYSLSDNSFNGALFDVQRKITDYGLNFGNYNARFLPVSPIDIFFQTGWSGHEDDCDLLIGPNASSPGGRTIEVAAGEARKSLLQFDLSILPTNVQVISATLRLHTANCSGSGLTIDSYAIKRPWVMDEASWTHASAGTMWDAPGCSGLGDRDGTAFASTLASQANTWYGWDLTALAGQWIADPDANHGVLMQSSSPGTSMCTFISSNHPELPPAAYHRLRPKLDLVLALPPGEPTPTSTATPTPTSSPTETETSTTTPTGTHTPTTTTMATPTQTATTPPTSTATATPTVTITPSATVSALSSATLTPTGTPVATVSPTPTGEATSAATSTPSATGKHDTPTGTVVQSATASMTGVPGVTRTATLTLSPTVSPSASGTVPTPQETPSTWPSRLVLPLVVRTARMQGSQSHVDWALAHLPSGWNW
jgi:hypothetical protein